MSESTISQKLNGEIHNSLAVRATPAVEAILAEQSTSEFFREPVEVLDRAEKVAKALKQFLDRKTDKVEFNGKRYPCAEDWQFVGAFFGHTARVRSTQELSSDNENVDGYIAMAEVVDQSGRIVSAAEAACTRAERNWASKPDFQLRSMAQTRACAKSLRNVFAWVMVLAGLAATPAEEMTEETTNEQWVAAPKRKSQAPNTQVIEPTYISEAQQKRLFAIAREHNVDKDEVRAILERHGFEFSREITRDKYKLILREIEGR